MGKRRLEEAMIAARDKFPQLAFEVEWFPFQLDASLPAKKNKMKHYEAKVS